MGILAAGILGTSTYLLIFRKRIKILTYLVELAHLSGHARSGSKRTINVPSMNIQSFELSVFSHSDGCYSRRMVFGIDGKSLNGTR